jgi:hypothetical protein
MPAERTVAALSLLLALPAVSMAGVPERSDAARCPSARDGACEAGADPASHVPSGALVRFGGDLGLSTDLLLEGERAAAEVVFPLPRAWTVVSDAVLNLQLEHSGALLPDASSLVVALNEQPVATVPLAGDAGEGVSVDVRLPSALLQPWNRISLRATQRARPTCEDPFDPSLWTRVLRESSIGFAWSPNPLGEPDLGDLPYPFFDETGFGPARVAIAAGDAPTPAVVHAAGVLGLALGRWAAYRRVQVAPPVADLRDASTHVLVVGTPADNPLVAQLLGDTVLDAGEGWVRVLANPHHPGLAVLVVAGADDAGVAKAAAAVGGRQRAELLSGATSRVRFVAEAGPPTSRELPRTAPPSDSYTLRELGMDSVTVRGFHTPAVRVPLGLEGDALAHPDSAEVTLVWGHAPGLDPRLSALEVRLDGATVGAIALTDAAGTSRREATVPLPAERLAPDSVLDVRFHLVPAGIAPCEVPSDGTLWATLHADTSLVVPRDHLAELPDLSRLRHHAWPFTLEPERGETFITVPDHPTPSEVSAGLSLAAELGRQSRAEDASLRLLVASEAPLAGTAAHLVLLEGGARHDGIRALEQRAALRYSGNRLQGESGAWIELATQGLIRGSVEELLDPDGSARAVLVVRALNGDALLPLVGSLSETTTLAELHGDVALWSEDRWVALDVRERRSVGTRAVRAQLVDTARRHWGLLGVAVLGAALFLSALRRAWARAKGGG